MENIDDENLRKNLWQQQQLHGNLNQIPHFYASQHASNSYDMHRGMSQQPHHQQQQSSVPSPLNSNSSNNNNNGSSSTPPENMQFLYDNHGAYVKIYYPNTQNQLPSFQQQVHHQQPQVLAKPPPTNVIHHLVSSLGPNSSGSYSPFGETMANNNVSLPPMEHPMYAEQIIQSPAPQQQAPVHHQHQQQQQQQQNNVSSNNNVSSPIVNNNSNVKKRIVAEVKPMRMSYSDVVSKNQASAAASNFGSTNSASSSPNTTLPVTSKNIKVDKSGKFGSGSFEKKSQDDKVKKSPINSIGGGGVNNINTSANANNGNSSASNPDRKSPTSAHIARTPLSGGANNQHQKQRKFHNTSKAPHFAASMKGGKFGSDSDDESTSCENDFELDDDMDDMEYYNVPSYHNIEKISTSKNNSASTSYKKVKVTPKEAAAKKSEKTQKRSGKSLSRKRQKHEVLMKLFMAWMEYVLKFIRWLGILIYDVFYLSCGIIWDRLSWCYQCTEQGLANVRNELSGNPGRTAWLWVKNKWIRFDARFDKKSRWAFWRWMFRRKAANQEQSKENFKDGKLPKTADEAMKSLLNCKGKDAYSILGVSATCSQEQIRKHYKKIAVLVHPDKNKQPGAEEAFKVLQRSFELIGEPESRQQYDKSMAEALNAEKAFSELNDLLIQLQTKISEAANTIRCSSCCFRHPRKPTGRKPFAARECSTCKIRHPAREGDIWAETTMFGFRWKYLALMEGNVYDITQWALCQRGALSHLQPNSCVVQYKIVLGGNQQQQSHEKIKKEQQTSEANMDDFFLNNIYAGQNPQQQQQQNARRRFKKN